MPTCLSSARSVRKRSRSSARLAVTASSLSATKTLLKESIQKKGFQFQHEIPIDEKGEKQVILSFVKNKETLIVMLWSENGKKTYFSYGITK